MVFSIRKVQSSSSLILEIDLLPIAKCRCKCRLKASHQNWRMGNLKGNDDLCANVSECQ